MAAGLAQWWGSGGSNHSVACGAPMIKEGTVGVMVPAVEHRVAARMRLVCSGPELGSHSSMVAVGSCHCVSNEPRSRLRTGGNSRVAHSMPRHQSGTLARS